MRLMRWLLLRVLPDSAEGQSILGDFLEERARRPPSVRRAMWSVATAIDLAVHYLPARLASVAETLARDVRHGLRLARRHARVFLMAAASLALAIGFSTAAFTVTSATSIKRALADDASLVRLWRRHQNGASVMWPTSEVPQLRDASALPVESIAVSDQRIEFSAVQSTARVGFVSGGYFATVHGMASLGRMFVPADQQPSGATPVVLDRTYWRRELGGDPAILGKPLTIGDTPAFVIGVADRDFIDPAPGRAVMWTPEWSLNKQSLQPPASDAARAVLFLRLPKSVTLERLNVTLAEAAGRVSSRVTPPITSAEAAVVVSDEARLATRKAIAGSMAILVVVLVLAYANTATLLIAVTASRRHEVAVRLSCGATRTRVGLQFMAEALTLSVVAGGAGLGCVKWLAPIIATTLGWKSADLDPAPRVYSFVALAILIAAIVIAGAMAYVALRQRVESCRPDTRDEFGHNRALGRVRTVCVAAQAAASVVLVVLGALQLRALAVVTTQDPGFDVANLVTLTAPTPMTRDDGTRTQLFWTEAIERVRSLPGVEAVTRADLLPFSMTLADPFSPRQARVDKNYFDTLRIALRRGRGFSADEVEAQARVAVVNEALAKRYWDVEDALGSTLRRVDSALADVRVIGIAADTTLDKLNTNRTPIVYLPSRTASGGLAVRSPDPSALASRLVEATRALVPGVVPSANVVLDDYQRDFEEPRRFAELATCAATFGLFLSMSGLIGITTYAIRTRTREIGVRKALGADNANVVSVMMREALRPVAIGLPIGLCGALLTGGLVAHQLYGLSDRDPWALTLATVVVAGSALIAVLLPARRVLRIDPAEALRDL